jgi:mannobiose 2-epimerase
MKAYLTAYKKEVEIELNDILSFWSKYTIDDKRGGFYGKVDNENKEDSESPKGVVLQSRILWAFSAAYNQTKNSEYLLTAQRAYDYLEKHFLDNEFGGVYWSVDCNGQMLDGRKQIYGLAFCIYGLSEYYKASDGEKGMETALELFEKIEQYSFDKKRKGYFEAFSRDWKLLADLRLSGKDANEKKTMNTHLHLIEAYANLYEVWPDYFLGTQIKELLEVFLKYIINHETGHLILFFDEEWNEKSKIISYGHDIEAAWLLQQCAEKINDHELIEKMKKAALKITNAAFEGLDTDGGLWYEFDPGRNSLVREKHSWPQAEAMIGSMNAYQITNCQEYLEKSYNSWQFIKQHIKDKKNGEWFWGVNADYSIMEGKDKVGFWKCPYHNTRACLEIIKRIS